MKKLLFSLFVSASILGAQPNPKILLSTADINIVFDGNSLLAGAGGLQKQDFALYIKTWLVANAKSVTWHSFGVKGQSTRDMMKDRITQIYSLVDTNKINILIAGEDINSILNDSIKAWQNFNDFSTYFSGAKQTKYNYCILWNSPYPRLVNGVYNSPYWDSTKLAQQKQFFDTIQTVHPDGVDIVVNLRNCKILGGQQAQSYNPKVNFDSVHDKTLGYDSLGQYIIDNSLLKIFTLNSRDTIITAINYSFNDTTVCPELIAIYDILGNKIESALSGTFVIAIYSNGEKRKIVVR